MSWSKNYVELGHNIFIAFIECKIEGNWEKRTEFDKERDDVLRCRDNAKNNLVHIIEPDGLRRILQFSQGATLSIGANTISYENGYAQEITVDEKEQSGKGKTRDTLH